MNLEQSNVRNEESRKRDNSSEKGLFRKYEPESVYEKINMIQGKDREVLDNALNLANLDFDQIESIIFDKDSGFNEERGAKISSLLGDLKFHTDEASKKIIARDLVYCLEGKVLH